MNNKVIFISIKDFIHGFSFFVVRCMWFFRFGYITNELRISLTFIPIAWASILFGPLAGALTGALGDILGWAVNQ